MVREGSRFSSKRVPLKGPRRDTGRVPTRISMVFI